MKYPIRILHVVGNMDIGGAEQMIMNYFRSIDREKFIFDFIVHTECNCLFDNEIESLGGRIYHFPKFNFFNMFQYRKHWYEFLNSHNEYLIIHSHIRSFATFFIDIAKSFGIKVIIHSHSTSNGKGFKGVIKSIFQYPLRWKGDYFIACSQEAGKWLFGNKIIENSEKYIILNNAIDVSKFSINNIVREELRNAYSINDCFVIGVVGRITEAKNPRFILSILKECVKQNSKTKLVWCGEGELMKEIISESKIDGLTDNILFLGNCTDMEKFMQMFDILLLPSLWEGFPMVLIEAQAAGLPCLISSNITKKVKITSLVHILDLEDSISKWCEYLFNMNTERKDTTGILIESGYDINTSVKILQTKYIELLSKKEGIYDA